jgi:hypothetical protein
MNGVELRSDVDLRIKCPGCLDGWVWLRDGWVVCDCCQREWARED